ncbi:MAG: hypothetical protein HRT57_12170 [Crocinitomicaceae bacterium]|nr:hypothetical protein [Crocinitomicaceae bacterium]
MNKVLLFIGFALLVNVGHSQYDSKVDGPISQFKAGFMWFYTGLRPAKEDKVRKYDRLIFDLTYNDWNGDSKLFQNHWASIGLNTNFMFDIPLAKGNKVALGVGVSHQYTNIRHNNNLIKDYTAGTTIYAPKTPTDTYTKSVFGGNSFSIPLELRFRNEGWKHFKFHIGGKIGYQVNAFSKQVGTVNGKRSISKSYGFADNSKLLYSAHVRIGLRNWALFASYNFNKIFKNESSVQLNQVQAGISISLF